MAECYCDGMILLQQGAEARLYETTFFEKPCIVKQRFSKKYRHPEIDEKLTRKRVSQEVRCLQRCRKIGIFTPAIYFVDLFHNVIFLEKISGITLREHIKAIREKSPTNSYDELTEMVRYVGAMLAKLHDADIIHGDLTTSNMIVNESNSSGNVFLIDFGLSYSSSLAEDKGVDLYVLERALLSTHPNSESLFEELLDSYKTSCTKSKSVLSKLDEVRLRGRKRSMVG